MSLTKETIAAIRLSWSIAEPQAASLLSRFYDTLFAMDPSVAEMFSGTDMAAQKAKLGAALGLVVREVDNPGTLFPALTALGRRHADFGVTSEQYDLVGAALLSAMEETLGERFCAKTRDAWANAYGAVAAAMIAGAESAAMKSA